MMKHITKKIKLSLVLTVAAVSVSSCSYFSPKYTKPNIKTPALWNSQDKTIEKTKNWDLTKLAWWREFDDPVLNNLITTALKDNNNLQIAIGNILQANAEVNKANYSWLPTASIGGSGFISQSFNTTGNINIPNLNVPNSHSVSGGGLAGLMPSYTLNIARQLETGRIARFSKEEQINNKNSIRLEIISQVSAAYFSLLSSKEQLKYQKMMVAKLQDLYKYTEIQNRLGKSSPLSAKSIKQFLESQKSKIPEIQYNITYYQNALRILTGRYPGKITLSRTLDDINAGVKVPVNLPSQVLENRPDVIIAEYKLKKANANIGLARSQFFPSIDLTGTFGNATLALGELATLNAWTWAGQAISAMPIFNMSIFADSDKAKAQYYQAYYNYINTLQKTFQDVDNNLSERAAKNRELIKQKKSLEAVKDQEKIINEQYKLGSISKMSGTGIIINRIYQTMQVIKAKQNSLISVINLYQALGAGYNVDNYSNPHYDNPAFKK